MALVDYQQLRGTHWYVVDEAARDAIPVDKRMIGMLVTTFVGGEYVTYRYDNSSLLDLAWFAPGNWTAINTGIPSKFEGDTIILGNDTLTEITPLNDSTLIFRINDQDYTLSNGSGGGGGSASWGSIMGTLSDQADLQSELDLKANQQALEDTAAAIRSDIVVDTVNVARNAGSTVKEIYSDTTIFTPEFKNKPTYYINTNGGGLSFTLPPLSACNVGGDFATEMTIIQVGDGTTTVSASGSETIGGQNKQIITTNNKGFTVQAKSATEWYIVQDSRSSGGVAQSLYALPTTTTVDGVVYYEMITDSDSALNTEKTAIYNSSGILDYDLLVTFISDSGFTSGTNAGGRGALNVRAQITSQSGDALSLYAVIYKFEPDFTKTLINDTTITARLVGSMGETYVEVPVFIEEYTSTLSDRFIMEVRAVDMNSNPTTVIYAGSSITTYYQRQIDLSNIVITPIPAGNPFNVQYNNDGVTAGADNLNIYEGDSIVADDLIKANAGILLGTSMIIDSEINIGNGSNFVASSYNTNGANHTVSTSTSFFNWETYGYGNASNRTWYQQGDNMYFSHSPTSLFWHLTGEQYFGYRGGNFVYGTKAGTNYWTSNDARFDFTTPVYDRFGTEILGGGGSQNLQQVTDVGNSTTNAIERVGTHGTSLIGDSPLSFNPLNIDGDVMLNYVSDNVYSGSYATSSKSGLVAVDGFDFFHVDINNGSGSIQFQGDGGTYGSTHNSSSYSVTSNSNTLKIDADSLSYAMNTVPKFSSKTDRFDINTPAYAKSVFADSLGFIDKNTGDSVYISAVQSQAFDTIPFTTTINIDYSTASFNNKIFVTGDCTINITGYPNNGTTPRIHLYIDTTTPSITLGTGFEYSFNGGTISNSLNSLNQIILVSDGSSNITHGVVNINNFTR